MVSNTVRGFLLGLGAGCVALSIAYLLRVTLGGVFLPELAAQTLFTITPGSVESGFVVTLQSLAKYSAFAGATAINILVYGLIGAFLFRSKDVSEGRTKFGRFVTFSLLSYLVLAVIGVILLLTTQIQSSPVTLPGLLISMVPPQLAFGAVLSVLRGGTVVVAPNDPGNAAAGTGVVVPRVAKQTISARGKKKVDRRRRLFIRAGVATAVGAVILAYGVGFLLREQQPTSPAPVASDNPTLLTSQAITPTADFYRVDVNIFPPSVNAGNYLLDVYGLVNTPTKLSLAQIQAMSVVEQYNTLECISNTIGGDLISTAQWRGVRLMDLLNLVGVQPSADYVVFRAVDGYSVGIPLEKAMSDGTLLAFEMNGAPLPTEHGFPIRAIVPGLYGMMNAKWITSIEAVSGKYEGYWQVRGWETDASYNTGSEIVIPGDAQVTDRFGIDGSSVVKLGSTIPIAGLAFSGDRGISKVEVSTDGGTTWTVASLIEPLSNYTWVFWSSSWNPPDTGKYSLQVRATDGDGKIQTATVAAPFPDGAAGYHIVDISVVSS